MTREGDVKVFWKNTIRPNCRMMDLDTTFKRGEWRFFQKPGGPDLDIPGRGITFFIGFIYSSHTTTLFFILGEVEYCCEVE